MTGVAREGEAVRRLREEPYAVVVTDLYVTRGQEEGVESIGALLREAGGTPVVVTGWPIEEEAAKAAGARSVVSKSFELGEVVRAVKEALAGREG